MKLGEIATVTIGTLINREQVKNSNYFYDVLNLKNFEDKRDEYVRIFTRQQLSSTLTRKGDIILRLTYPIKIIYIDEKHENLLVPSQMCIIRLNKENMNPLFFKWYFNSDNFKEQIELNIVGTSIKKISIGAIRNLKLPKIDLDTQNKIVDLIKLWEEEKKVMETIILKKESLYNSLIEEILEGKITNE